ncbi:hypothetical protein [Mycobacterium sp. DL440]|uniref:hypothetical protein n=1 Tax=Mycobacterium sp. DL440 TaxID=2675523 RepID=UPI001424724A|nr:hypothetical protein [Mycobacterium sp. DL440]
MKQNYHGDDEVVVSTVWLGLNHSFTDDGPPIIFETMVFGGVHDAKRVSATPSNSRHSTVIVAP